jgi:pyruvate ferredoxin oxidoreductase beta subunit
LANRKNAPGGRFCITISVKPLSGPAPAISIDLAREAVECNFWPIFEVKNGVYKINKKPKDKMPVADWMKKQGRFKHLFRPGNEHVLESTQAFVDKEWEKLLKLEESTS